MLTKPFIQPIKAFDVSTTNGTAIVSVLGGDTITSINYEIFSGTTSIYTNTIQVQDIGGAGTRNFAISLLSSMGLSNDNSYTIKARTSNGSADSEYSTSVAFYCYEQPTVVLKDSNNTTITSGYTFTAQQGQITVGITTSTISNPATISNVSLNILGITAQGKDLVYSSGETHSPFQIDYSNLTPTTGTGLYDSYEIQCVVVTSQRMVIDETVKGLFCNYAINGSGGMLSVENDYANGRIKASFEFNTVAPTSASITALAVDSENVYVGLSGNGFTVYNKSSGVFASIVAVPFGGTAASVLVVDSEKVYAAGGAGKFAIYDKSTGSFGALIATPFGSSTIRALAVDEQNVYAVSDGGKFAIYNKSTGSFGSLITTPAGTSNLWAIVADADNVYISGVANKFFIYDKSTGVCGSLITTPFPSGVINSLAIDDQNVYVGGISSSTVGIFGTYNKSAGSFDSPISLPSDLVSVVMLAIDSQNVYVVSNYRNFGIYNKQKQEFSDILSNEFVANGIRAIVADGNNVYVGGTPRELIALSVSTQIRRREIGTDNYFTLLTLNIAENFGLGKCVLYDYFAKNNTVYEYEIVTDNRTETVQVLSQFCKSYIADGAKGFELYEQWDIGAYQRNQKNVLSEPYGSKYPFVSYNAITNYNSGNDTALYRAPSNIGRQYFDSVAQQKYTKELVDFLTNHKVKVRKTYNGEIALVVAINAVPNSYFNELGNTLATTQFNWVEIGDFTDEDFKKLGITNGFTLYTE